MYQKNVVFFYIIPTNVCLCYIKKQQQNIALNMM